MNYTSDKRCTLSSEISVWKKPSSASCRWKYKLKLAINSLASFCVLRGGQTTCHWNEGEELEYPSLPCAANLSRISRTLA